MDPPPVRNRGSSGWSIADNVQDPQRLSDDFNMGWGSNLRGSGESSGAGGLGQRASERSEDFDLSDIGRLSDEFLASVPGLAGSPEKATGRRGDIDSEALAALQSGVRYRRTSSEAVMQMLSEEPSVQGGVAGGGGVQLARTSSDALMNFLKESEL